MGKEELLLNLKENLNLTEIIRENRRVINNNIHRTKFSYVIKRTLQFFLFYFILIWLKNNLFTNYLPNINWLVLNNKNILLVAIATILAVYHFRLLKSAKHLVNESTIILNESLKRREEINLLHDDFLNFAAIKKMISYLETGLADNLKECLNLYHKEEQNNKVIEEIKSSNAKLIYSSEKLVKEVENIKYTISD